MQHVSEMTIEELTRFVDSASKSYKLERRGFVGLITDMENYPVRKMP